MINYIGKCIIIEEGGSKILAFSDLHIGIYAKEISGINIEEKKIKEYISYLEKIFIELGKIDKIVILSDLIDRFNKLSQRDKGQIAELINGLKKYVSDITVIRGNHDISLKYYTLAGVSVRDYFLYGKIAFLHGDKDFEEINRKKIKFWVMGHLHPAITLKTESKSEKFKCFLTGSHKDKEIIILPSFCEKTKGIDLEDSEKTKGILAWPFDLDEFTIRLIDEGLQVYNFNKLKDVKRAYKNK